MITIIQSDNNKVFMRNRFDLSELAGAFVGLGTLIPFVVAYVPVQPMKAIGAAADTQSVGAAALLGVLMGLGFSFMLEGIRMMGRDWLVAAVLFALTLLILGVVIALVQQPALSCSRLALNWHSPAATAEAERSIASSSSALRRLRC